jgi:hypothetical protein
MVTSILPSLITLLEWSDRWEWDWFYFGDRDVMPFYGRFFDTIFWFRYLDKKIIKGLFEVLFYLVLLLLPPCIYALQNSSAWTFLVLDRLADQFLICSLLNKAPTFIWATSLPPPPSESRGFHCYLQLLLATSRLLQHHVSWPNLVIQDIGPFLANDHILAFLWFNLFWLKRHRWSHNCAL